MTVATRNWVFVAALVFGRMAFGFQFQTVATLGPELMAAFGLSFASLGSLIGAYMASGILVALPGGLLGRRYGERVVVGTGLACMVLGSVLAAAAAGPAGIAAGRLLAGAGAVALVVMQGKMVSDRFPGQAFLPVMSLLTGAFPVGVGLAGLLHDPVMAAAGWPGMFLAGSLVAATALTLFLSSCGRHPPGAGAGWAMPSRRECVLVIVAGLIWTAYNAGYYGFLSYMPSLMASRGDAPAMVALVLLIATWTNLPATIIGGAMAVRFGNWPVFLAGTLTGMVAVAGPAVLDWPLLWGALFGSVASVHAGVIVAVGTLSARPENRAVGMGLFYSTYYVGGTVIPAVCGKAGDLAGGAGGAMLAAAALAGLAIPAYLAHRRLAGRPE